MPGALRYVRGGRPPPQTLKSGAASTRKSKFLHRSHSSEVRKSGRTTMKPLMLSTMLATLLLSDAAVAQTPSWLPPADSARCPSKWGAGDERGAANHMKPQTVLNAAKL